jgi:hypothetical protein
MCDYGSRRSALLYTVEGCLIAFPEGNRAALAKNFPSVRHFVTKLLKASSKWTLILPYFAWLGFLGFWRWFRSSSSADAGAAP